MGREEVRDVSGWEHLQAEPRLSLAGARGGGDDAHVQPVFFCVFRPRRDQGARPRQVFPVVSGFPAGSDTHVFFKHRYEDSPRELH